MKSRLSESKRICLDQLKYHHSGITAGRIICINSSSLFLADIYATAEFSFNQINPAIKEGDLVMLDFIKKSHHYQIRSIEILTSVQINPVNNPASPYHKLHKNQGKIRSTLYRRQQFFHEIRQFFIRHHFLEIQTPTLVESPGVEYHLEPFRTAYYDYQGQEHSYFLPTSPEFSLKEALSAGFENIFEIAKVFRNQGEQSILHRPEFFMLEWYRAYTDYYDLMADCEVFLKYLARKIYKKNYIFRDNYKCDLTRIERIRVKELFYKLNINLDHYLQDEHQFITNCGKLLNLSDHDVSSLTKEDLFFKVFLSHIEPHLGFEHPVIVYEYPLEMAALSRQSPENPLYAERFELYICGIELANAFSELTDPSEQERRFQAVLAYRKQQQLSSLDMPERFMRVLKNGMPPSAGIALGLERLFMLFEQLDSIDQTNLF